jgi:hypothetical protein
MTQTRRRDYPSPPIRKHPRPSPKHPSPPPLSTLVSIHPHLPRLPTLVVVNMFQEPWAKNV